MKKVSLLALALLLSSGCYHATIETGLQPGPQTIEVPFAHCWIYGLVPPATVETMAQCPNGVARVETQQSFVNGLVGVLTFGIYTPMDILVTCAGDGGTDSDSYVETELEFAEALATGQPFLVRVY